MSEEATTTEQPTDKELNFRRLEEERDRFRQQVEELRPYRDRELVRQAGFDPDTGEGKSLARDLAGGAVEPEEGTSLSETLASYAESEYGWKPQTALTPAEAEQARAADQQQQLGTVTTPDNPETIDQQIVQARQDGNWALASDLELRKTLEAASG